MAEPLGSRPRQRKKRCSKMKNVASGHCSLSRSVSALGKLSVEEFMALPTSDEDDTPPFVRDKVNTSRKRKRVSDKQKTQTGKLCIDVLEQNEFLEQEDDDFLEQEWIAENKKEWKTDEDDQDMGEVEPRPPEITNWKGRVS